MKNQRDGANTIRRILCFWLAAIFLVTGMPGTLHARFAEDAHAFPSHLAPTTHQEDVQFALMVRSTQQFLRFQKDSATEDARLSKSLLEELHQKGFALEGVQVVRAAGDSAMFGIAFSLSDSVYYFLAYDSLL